MKIFSFQFSVHIWRLEILVKKCQHSKYPQYYSGRIVLFNTRINQNRKERFGPR